MLARLTPVAGQQPGPVDRYAEDFHGGGSGCDWNKAAPNTQLLPNRDFSSFFFSLLTPPSRRSFFIFSFYANKAAPRSQCDRDDRSSGLSNRIIIVIVTGTLIFMDPALSFLSDCFLATIKVYLFRNYVQL